MPYARTVGVAEIEIDQCEALSTHARPGPVSQQDQFLTVPGGRSFPREPRVTCRDHGTSPVHKLLCDANLPKSHLFNRRTDFNPKEE